MMGCLPLIVAPRIFLLFAVLVVVVVVVVNVHGLIVPPSSSMSAARKMSVTCQSGKFQQQQSRRSFLTTYKRTAVIANETPSSSTEPTKRTRVPCDMYNNKDSCTDHDCNWRRGKCIDPPMYDANPKKVIPRPYERQEK